MTLFANPGRVNKTVKFGRNKTDVNAWGYINGLIHSSGEANLKFQITKKFSIHFIPVAQYPISNIQFLF
ncbi:hypothetical protein A2468_04400 [Candidatus Falkowbacteria bacterium RIFOXYC2_FULL_46_15]|nr:MAG: hypothetical protein A2468_04400 [Candidatus Falkowbacteria bacterium RIFOXYC2_FULL_46_15]